MNTQQTGLMWNLEYPNNITYLVHLVFPLALCIVDMKGGHQLCGMYDKYFGVKRACISCYCSEDNLDNTNEQCINVLHHDMHSYIMTKTSEELQEYSQHKLVNNAFFNVDTGGWKYGIWGMCPSEILHQFYEGILLYALKYLFENVLRSSQLRILCIGVDKLISECRNQSDRSYPQATFTMGISHTAKMKGTEKFAAIFYIALYLHTKDSERVLDSTNKRKWLKLFQNFLSYRDWLMQDTHTRSDVLSKQSKIKNLLKQYKSLIQRTDGAGLKIPKIHELLHVCRDILRHGPPIGYDTCPTESNHRPLKSMSQNTQRIKSRFELQTANRLYEDNILHTAYNDTSILFASINKSKQINKNPILSQTQGLFYLQTNENNQLSFLRSIAGSSITNHHDFGDDLTTFLYDNLFCHIQNPNTTKIRCYSTYKRHGIIFYGCTRNHNALRSNSSWAQFIWNTNKNENIYVPGKCIVFLDLSNITYNHNDPIYASELHVVIKSLQKSIGDRNANSVQQLAKSASFTSNPKYYIVSVNTIYDQAFVVPDIGNDDNTVLYVYPRDNWKELF